MKRVLAAIVLSAACAAAPARPALADQAGYLFAYGLQDARYQDFIASLDAYKPLGHAGAPIRPYVDLLVTSDKRTGTNNDLPVIYSDNYAVIAGGVQYTNAKGWRVYAQAGPSMKVGAISAVKPGIDFRGGASLYREWGPTSAAHSSYGNFYGSALYYSRYSDAIAYLQTERIRNIGNSSAKPLELFVRGVLELDTKSLYYSNLAELAGGVRVHPFGRGPILSLDYVRGFYLRNTARPAGQGSTYGDFRPTIVYGVNL